jgi:phosphatidylserine/phosphatidylglycerophosphate/cardiolipin synthase-like enzyme
MQKKYLYLAGFTAIISLSVSIFAYSARPTPPGEISYPNKIQATGTIQVAFSPQGGITDMIVQELNTAKRSIEVQAYSFTSDSIAKALVNAYKRGVKVRVILDKSQSTERYSSATYLTNNGIPTHIDRAFAIAHSKIMIVDRADVITGSFNFTKSAENNNGENCLILRGNRQLVGLYEKNWDWRWNATN